MTLCAGPGRPTCELGTGVQGWNPCAYGAWMPRSAVTVWTRPGKPPAADITLNADPLLAPLNGRTCRLSNFAIIITAPKGFTHVD